MRKHTWFVAATLLFLSFATASCQPLLIARAKPTDGHLVEAAPMTISLTVQNNSLESVSLFKPNERYPWVSAYLRQPDGTFVLLGRKAVSPKSGGTALAVELPIGGSTNIPVCLSRIAPGLRAGNHELRLEALLWATSNQDNVDDVQVKVNCDLIVSVEAKNDVHLRGVAERLKSTVISERNGTRMRQLEELFTMDASIAKPYWDKVMEACSKDKMMCRILIMDALKLIRSPEALELLESAWKSKDNFDTSHLAEDALVEIYHDGDPVASKRIANMFLTRTGKLPRQPKPKPFDG